MNKFILRRVNIDDAAELQNVLFLTWVATYPNAGMGVTSDDIGCLLKNSLTEEVIEKRKKQISEYLNSETHLLLVAEKNKKIVGFCNAVKKHLHNQIQAINILPEYQRLGLGKLFFEQIKIFFHDNRDIIIEVVEYNQNAINFYKKLGFVETGKKIRNEQFRLIRSNMILPEIEMIFRYG